MIKNYPFLCLLIWLAFTGCSGATINQDPKKHKVAIHQSNGKFSIYRNGKKYTIKGAAGFVQLKELRSLGGNTIRIWDTLHLKSVLDDAQKNGIAVIVGLPLPESRFLDAFYKDSEKVHATFRAYRNLVSRFKNHPAVLMWCLGNELEFPYKPEYNVFYDTFNTLVKIIHTDDPDHPVITTMVNFSRKNVINITLRTKIDAIAFNTFGELKNLKKEIDRFSWFWKGAYLITEWGVEGPWQGNPQTVWRAYIESTSTKKAEQYAAFYKKYIPVKDPRFLGDFVFYWGEKQEATSTWYSIFLHDGSRSESVRTLQKIWTGKTDLPPTPPLEYMLLDEKGAADNIITPPGQTVHARLVIQDTAGYRYRWEILPEDWLEENGIRSDKKPLAIRVWGLASGRSTVTFRTPEKEGPYRLFAYVYDAYGNFATANTPFYVIGKK